MKTATSARTHTTARQGVTHFLALGHSIALWRMPHHDEVYLAASDVGIRTVDDLSLEDTAPGFVMAPFDPAKPAWHLSAQVLLTFKNQRLHAAQGIDEATGASLEKVDTSARPAFHFRPGTHPNANPSSYPALVARCVQAIGDKKFEKIVPSRYKDVPSGNTHALVDFFHALCDRYPHALVSLVSSPETGTWLGATPEALASVDEQHVFRTVALAGTKPFVEGMDVRNVAWTQKEIEEQALVSRYIINCFKKLRVREYQEHGPRTLVAGNVMHLKTDYEVDMKAIHFPQFGTVMLRLLHPTSAVCGMPLEASLNFLKRHEGYDRSFYSGFLGPVGLGHGSHLFVNLRCTQVFDDRFRFYAGAGVTQDSQPDEEWAETEWKMNTLASVVL
ncbi:MAG: chorismate-binding protein [Cyclobacteriaceae bacterium]|jgi:isochorismate synthase|nr:chorismate-binding protein [Cyclobacteriaceae bacterium]